MKNVSMLMLALAMSAAAAAQAQDSMREPMQSRDQVETQDRERVYGYELMTPQERNEYHARMRTLTTAQEREAFRLEHHRKMQERAKAQGKTLPEMPPADRGPGMGPGMGPGSGGMGPGGGGMGGGMGPGQRR